MKRYLNKDTGELFTEHDLKVLWDQFGHEMKFDSYDDFTDSLEEVDTDRAEELLAGELYEMVALGWTDDEARENEDAFFERIGDYADGLTKEEVWEVWNNVIENA